MTPSNIISCCVGYNNIKAMYEVVNDRYGYNFTGRPNQFDKAKQIGTECLHLFGKYYVAAKTYDGLTNGVNSTIGLVLPLKLLTKLFPFPNLLSWENVTSLSYTETATLGLSILSSSVVALAYISPKLATITTEAHRLSSKDPINIASRRVTIIATEAINAAIIATPLILGYRAGGTTGALFFSIPIHVIYQMQNNRKSTAEDWLKPYLPAAYACATLAASYCLSYITRSS